MTLRMLRTAEQRMLDEAASEWGVPRRRARVVFWTAGLGTVLVLASYLHRPIFRFVTAEDSLLEWSQFAGFVLTTVVAALIARRLRHRGLGRPALLFVLVAAAGVFISGEEIAWGQRLLGIEIPESLDEINKQGELTLHNIGGILYYFNWAMMLLGAYGSIGAWVLRTRSRWRQHPLFGLFVPPLFLSSWFFVLFAYKATRIFLLPESRYPYVKSGEWAEFALAFAGATWLAMALVRLRRQGPDRLTVVASPAEPPHRDHVGV